MAKKTLAVAGALAFALCGFGETYPEDWFTPPSGFWRGGIGDLQGVVAWTGREWVEIDVEVKQDGSCPELEEAIEIAKKQLNNTLAETFTALYECLRAQVMVFNMAENLDAFFRGGSAVITNADGTQGTGTFRFERVRD